MTVSVPPRLDLLSQSRPPGRAFARLGRSGRTWQRRLFTNTLWEAPTRYRTHPLNARNLHPRLSLAHRLRFTLSPVQRTRSGWLLPPTSSARARSEELLQANRAASDNSACCTSSASRSQAVRTHHIHALAPLGHASSISGSHTRARGPHSTRCVPFPCIAFIRAFHSLAVMLHVNEYVVLFAVGFRLLFCGSSPFSSPVRASVVALLY